MVDCCPSPSHPVIVPNQKTESQRKALQAIMYGEVGMAICRAYTLGFFTGLLHLISMWIDYLGYATMHYCQVMVVCFCGAIEVIMLYMNASDGGILQQRIFDTKLTIATFYVMILFSATKCVTGFIAYKSFKKEFADVYGDSRSENDGFWNDNRYQPNAPQQQYDNEYGNYQNQQQNNYLQAAQDAEANLVQEQQRQFQGQNQQQQLSRDPPQAASQNTSSNLNNAPQPSATQQRQQRAPPFQMSNAELQYHLQQTQNYENLLKREAERRNQSIQ